MILGSLVASLILVACAGGNPDTTTYRDADERSLFELPNEWNTYGADELAQLSVVPFIPELAGFPAITLIAFDGAAGRDLANLTVDVTTSPYPIGAQLIRSIGPQSRDLVSRQTLALSAYDLTDVQGIQEIESEDFSFGRQYDGIRRFVGITAEDGELEGAIYMLAVTNPDTTEIYSMAVGCSLACFERQRDEIFKVVDSWLVNTRR